MKIAVINENGQVTLRLGGRIDSVSIKQLEDEIPGAVSLCESVLTLDFDGIDYINSSGLRIVLEAAKRLRRNKKELRICNVDSEVYKIFKLTGFTGLLAVSLRP